MAEKIISGDSLQNEFVAKFNGMADEVNALKESGVGSGGAVVELSGESGTLTDEQYEQCTRPNTTIKWTNGSGGNTIYEPWRFVSPTYYFKSVYIDADECINNTIEIDQISHGWKRKSTAYSGGSQVSVTQTLTSGTKIGAITVDGKTTALYAPEGGGSGGSGSADAIIDVDKLPAEENAYLFQNGAKVEEYLMRKVVVRIVETLPEVGELFLTSTSCNIYYQKGDDEAYCYLTPDVPPGGNFTGWAGLSSGFGWVSDFGYGGVITDESQATDTSRKYLVYHAGEYINTQAIYRVTEFNVSTLFAGMVNSLGKPVTMHVVDTLPTTGEAVMQGDIVSTTGYVIYYQKSDNRPYAWVPTALGVPTDMWLPAEDVLAMQGIPYGGVITSPLDAENQNALYVLVKISIKLYHYKDGWHEIGGEAESSEGGGLVVNIPADGSLPSAEQIMILYDAWSQGKPAVARAGMDIPGYGSIEIIYSIFYGVKALDGARTIYIASIGDVSPYPLTIYRYQATVDGEVRSNKYTFNPAEE